MASNVKKLTAVALLGISILVASMLSRAYDPAQDVILEKIEYRWLTGHRNLHEKIYSVQKQHLRLTENIQPMGGEEPLREQCAELTREENDSLQTLTRQIIRERWRNTKQFEQLAGAKYSYHGPIEELKITYVWNEITESVSVRFSTKEDDTGTRIFTSPEVLVIQRLLSGVTPIRFDTCSKTETP